MVYLVLVGGALKPPKLLVSKFFPGGFEGRRRGFEGQQHGTSKRSNMGMGPQGTPEGPRGTAAKDLAQISIQILEKDFSAWAAF